MMTISELVAIENERAAAMGEVLRTIAEPPRKPIGESAADEQDASDGASRD